MPPVGDALNLVGTTIAEKYRVDSVVGQGGFAIVYRATHLIWNRPVAIKVFKSLSEIPDVDRDKLLSDFIQEGALLAELSERSAAICQARDVGTLSLSPDRKDWLPYMVLEWLEGSSLETVLAEEKARGLPPRSLEQTLRLLQPAAEALALAHRKGVAHRDVKPANIFLCGDPHDDQCTVKLLDFGIAKVVQDAQKASGTFTKTAGQITSFTPSYGAPEQFSRSHGSTGPWTDVFAFALVIVECLTRREPLEGDDFMQIAYASADKSRRPTPRTLGAQVSDEAEAIFAKALAVSPQERYRTMGDFWEALRRVIPSDSIRSFAAAEPSGRTLEGSGRVSAPGGADASAPTVPVSSPLQAQAVPPGQTLVDPPAAARAAGMSTTTPGTVSTARSVPTRRSVVGARFLGALVGAGIVVAGAIVYVALSHGSQAPPPAHSASAAPVHASAKPAAPASGAVKELECPAGMISIRGASFYMGSDDDRDEPQERPAHNVLLSPYCIDKFELTVDKYKACSDDGQCKRASSVNEWDKITKHDHEAYDPLCNVRDPATRGKHPINCVDWDMAKTYCFRHGLRLPSEAEWEFAARGPDGRRYPWGDEAPTAGHLNACGLECVGWGKAHGVTLTPMYQADDGFPATAPVGSFPSGKSRYGVEDVVGNVWEWVGDWYGAYPSDDQKDPAGPASGTARVIRGGGWNGSNVAWVRPTYRYMADPKMKTHGIGFRCAKSLP